ncbi:MAG: 6-carboxytetrahydropterin synthase [Caldilineaceae bacterium]
MYTLAVQRDFVAQHYLIGGDWGAANQWHSHHYRLEVLLEGAQLDRHGYLVDIVDVEQNLEKIVAYYRDKTLNDLPEFAGLNPSIEHFTRIVCQTLVSNSQPCVKRRAPALNATPLGKRAPTKFLPGYTNFLANLCFTRPAR